MTSRTSSHGLATSLGLKPDLKTLGKFLGGGLAFGALGGREAVMAAFDPRVDGALPHSGTFNNNTLAMHAGHEGIANIYTPAVATAHTAVGEQLRATLNETTLGTRMFFTGVGSLMAAHITTDGRRDVQCGTDIHEVQRLKDLFWFEMLEEGFWMARRGFIALVLGTPQAELDRFVEAVARFIAKHRVHLELKTT
jgi:glutamate-1-semialdehyde 2,1-aminomutase